MSGRATALLGLLAAAACAQPGAPPGGQPDETPPQVREVEPAAFDTLADLDAPVVIRFDERISERLEGIQRWNEGVLVSPATSPLEVDAGRRDIKISLVEGWEPDRIYRVVVLPVYRDLFGNVRTEPIELVFSTGAPFHDGALAGFVVDRITGEPSPDARIRAVHRADQAEYVALSDTAGFFALRYLPAGAYDVRAWQDQNRDRLIDFFEVQDSLETSLAGSDTAIVELALLLPDTTPANLSRAEALDSTAVELLFDDYFVGPIEGVAEVVILPDSSGPRTGTLLHPARYDSILAARVEAAEPDSAAEGAAGLDTAAVAAEDEEQPAPLPDPSRPTREVVLLLAQPLLPDTTYAVAVGGLTNIRGVPGGGGSAAFRTLPPPADTVPADTVAPTGDPAPDSAAPRGSGPSLGVPGSGDGG